MWQAYEAPRRPLLTACARELDDRTPETKSASGGRASTAGGTCFGGAFTDQIGRRDGAPSLADDRCPGRVRPRYWGLAAARHTVTQTARAVLLSFG
ncbi:hypothetical protein [Streptomyces monashensis]|uniref:hypothetical protein n=1 Tax=Streptomyces monashensis TaxID=1678012 RepID=UPI00116056C6|nr:hypothetical protein [Streptomyces monashensis]